MKTLRLILTLGFLGAFSILSQAQSKVTAVKIGDRIDVSINNALFTQYRFAENEKYPFFYPVNGPSGFSVTSFRNSLYPHHSSLFFGCDRVNGGNYWQQGLERGQIRTLRAEILESGEDKVVIVNECIWTRPEANAPIKDVRTITITAPSKDLYVIDFEITMEMLMDVEIEKTNHSFFSGRMAPDLAVTAGGVMVNAEGEQGEKGDEGTFGKRSPWMDCYGTRANDIVEGMAILQHPENPWYPSPWFTRDYGFFSPTPMYWPENDKTTNFKKGESLHLKYRVIVHNGDTETAKIATRFESYSKSK